MATHLHVRVYAISGNNILKYCSVFTGFLALILLTSSFTNRAIKNKHFNRTSKGTAVVISKPAAPTINYGAAQTFTLNAAITPVTPTASNVSAPGYKTGVAFASLATNPTYLKVDSHGNIYFLDSERKDVKKLDAAGNLSVYSSGYDNPSSIAMDGNDNLYVLEYNLGYVVKTYASDAHTEQIATGNTNIIGANKAGDLYYIFYDGASHLYKKFAADGHSQDLGITFVNPVSMAVDGNDNVYVLDNASRTITKIKPDNTTNVEFAADATQSIVTVAVDGAGDIYWTNQSSTLHKKLVNSNTYQDIALPGPGIYGLGISPEGKIFQGDYSAKAINQIVPSGGYYINKRLPEGLAFDIATGTISGTPTAVSAATAYNITAYNNTGSTTTSFTLGVASDNANLNALTVTGAAISPSFDAATITYTSSVASTVASVGITPAVADAGATITYNNNPVTSGALLTVPLTGGANNIAFIVTAPAGNTKTYTITITKAVPPTLNYGAAQIFTLNAAITPVTPTVSNVSAPGYKTGVAFASLATNPTYLRVDSHGNIYFLDSERKDVKKLDAAGNLSVYSSGYDYPSNIAMDGNDNLYVLEYNLGYVVKTYASDAHTEQIATGNTNIIGANKAGDLYYIFYDGASHLYKKFAADGHSQDLGITFVNPVSMAVDGNDNVYVLDNASRTITKIKPDNTTNVEFAADATQSIVTVAVDGAGDIYWTNQSSTLHKKLVNSNTYQDIALPGPGIYGLGISPEGKIFQGDYSAKAINQIVPSGGYYINKRLPEGLAFDIATGTISGTPTAVSAATVYSITAYNNTGGTTTATFTLGVASGNANLSALTVTGAAISPSFDAATITYTSSVASTVASVGITPAVADAGATITYNNNPVTSGALLTVPLTGGANNIVFIVTAPAGNTKTYTITINKLVPPAISYGAAQIFAINTAITPLTPTATNVGAFGYGGYTTLGGSDITQARSIGKDSQGNMYVLDAGQYKIYKYPANGGPGQPIITDGFYPLNFALDGNDNIYFVDAQDNILKKMDAGTVNVSTLASGFTTPYNIAATKNGTVYVADYSTNTVSKVPPGGGTPVAIGTGLNQPVDVAVDDDGNVYAGENTGKVKKIWMATDGHTDEIASFGQVFAVAVDKANNVYAADVQNMRIYEIPANGDASRVIISGIDYQSTGNLYIDEKGVAYLAAPSRGGVTVVAPTGGYFIDTKLPAGLSFDQTTGIISGTPTELSAAKNYIVTAYGPGGAATSTINIAVASANANLNALAVTGATISPAFDAGTIVYSGTVAASVASVDITPTVADAGATINYSGNPVTSGTVVTVQLAGGVNTIAFLVTAGAGNTKTYTITITKAVPPAISYGTAQTFKVNTAITPLTPTATNVGAFGYGGYTTLGGSDIVQAKSIRKDSQGNMYVADAGQYKIYKYPANGGPGQPIVIDGFYPTAIALDGDDNIYFIDAQDNILKKMDAGTGNVSTLASGFTFPYNIAATKNGTVYVADVYANTVIKVPAGGGTQVAIGTGINQPVDVAVDDDGNVYTGENSGKVKKIWMATDGHTEEIASFGQVFAVAVDKANNVYAADVQNMLIYEIPANGNAPRVIISGIDYQSTANMYINEKGVAYLAAPSRGGVTVVAPTGGYFMDKKSPAGLSFDQTTGIISGTPTKLSPATEYRVTVYSGLDSTSARITLGVEANINLTNLVTGAGTLTPAFNADSINYKLTVANGVTATAITATLSDASNALTINGTVATSGAPASATLNVGDNNIPIVVTSPLDNSTKTYTVKIHRISNNAALINLTTSAGGLRPAFDPVILTGYTTAQVPNSATGVTVTPTAADANVSGLEVRVNGGSPVPVVSGSTAPALTLNVGDNTVTVKVTAEDGTTVKTYTLTVHRALPNDANLTQLVAAPNVHLTLVPGADYKDFTSTVDNTVSSITVTPTARDAAATITVNGALVTSGSSSNPITLHLDTNTIYTTVTAQDGVTKKTYAMIITRQGPNNARLTSIATNPKATLAVVSGTDYKDYTATVSYATSSLMITPTTADGTATITVNGMVVASGRASAAVQLHADTTTIFTTVTAGDGVTKKTYAIKVTRLPSTNAKLAILAIIPKATLRLQTGANYKDFAATVTNSTGTVRITATTEDTSAVLTVNGTITVSGSASNPVTLNADTTTIFTTVTAQDGITKKTYAILITRQPASVFMKYEEQASPIVAEAVTVHQNVSPNGDGKGDALIIEGITAHPDNKLQIMSRSGALIYEAKGYDNATKSFDGHSSTNGKLQQPGTYFYSLEYKDGNEVKYKTGFIVLKY